MPQTRRAWTDVHRSQTPESEFGVFGGGAEAHESSAEFGSEYEDVVDVWVAECGEE